MRDQPDPIGTLETQHLPCFLNRDHLSIFHPCPTDLLPLSVERDVVGEKALELHLLAAVKQVSLQADAGRLMDGLRGNKQQDGGVTVALMTRETSNSNTEIHDLAQGSMS